MAGCPSSHQLTRIRKETLESGNLFSGSWIYASVPQYNYIRDVLIGFCGFSEHGWGFVFGSFVSCLLQTTSLNLFKMTSAWSSKRRSPTVFATIPPTATKPLWYVIPWCLSRDIYHLPSQISTDNNYVEPAMKQTCANKWGQVVDEFRVFNMLYQLTVTAPGIDELPHWFLRQAAPSICSPITHLFNLSLLTSTVPCQWKTSVITHVAKTKQPTQCSDYWPISISPILSHLLEKIVVRDYIYPIFTHSTTRHLFQDQFAFRPTGSPTSAIIHLTQSVSDLLQEHNQEHNWPPLSELKICDSLFVQTMRHPRMAVNDPAIPPVHPGLKRVSELNILGFQISDELEFTPHVNHITVTAVQSTYALRVLRAHGLNGPNLWEVSSATAVVKLTYACSAWWGYVDAGAKSRIQSTMKTFKRLGFLPEDVSFSDICQKQDNNLFTKILSNENHVLHQVLPPVRNILCSLRPRAHDRELPVANTAMRKNFITRLLYSKQ